MTREIRILKFCFCASRNAQNEIDRMKPTLNEIDTQRENDNSTIKTEENFVVNALVAGPDARKDSW